MHRRQFLQTSLVVPAAAALQAQGGRSFTFVHMTDTHIQPEMRAAQGVRECFTQINKLSPAFCIHGGDLVFDALEVGELRAKQLFNLYQESQKLIEAPVHLCLGNHDVFGISNREGVQPDHPSYAKKMFQDRFGPCYRSFNFGGWHFIILDSIFVFPDRRYLGWLDLEQKAWLKSDLEKNGSSTPVIVVTHIPFLSSAPQTVPEWKGVRGLTMEDAPEIVDLLTHYPVKMVLQGHTHLCDRTDWKGIQFITTGAVSGNWWKGPHQGFHEGFGVVRVDGAEATWSYQTYPWKASA